MLPAVKSQKYCCGELCQENFSPLSDAITSLHFNRLHAVRNGNPRALYALPGKGIAGRVVCGSIEQAFREAGSRSGFPRMLLEMWESRLVRGLQGSYFLPDPQCLPDR